MPTGQDWLNLAQEALPQSIKDVQTFYKIGKAAEKGRKELKGKNIAQEHLSVFKKDWLSREETRLRKLCQQYGRINRGYRGMNDPDFDKLEKECQKAKRAGNNDKFFKAVNAYDKALRAHLRTLKVRQKLARKLLPQAKANLKHHTLQFDAAKQLQSSFKDIMKVAVFGSFQTEFLIYMLHAKKIAEYNNICRSELKKTIKHLEAIIKNSKTDIQMTNDQITYIGSDSFEESLT